MMSKNNDFNPSIRVFVEFRVQHVVHGVGIEANEVDPDNLTS